MKRTFLLFFSLILSLGGLVAQNDYTSSIPIEGEKVVFKKTFPTSELVAKSETRELIIDAIQPYLDKKGSALRVDDSERKQIVCRIFDYLEISKSTWQIIAYNIRYNLVIDYDGNECTIQARDIHLQEYSGENQDKEDWYSAEYIFIKRNYKTITVKNIDEKIESKLVPYMDELFSSIKSMAGMR